MSRSLDLLLWLAEKWPFPTPPSPADQQVFLDEYWRLRAMGELSGKRE